jgi:hypothetical protein
LPLLATALCAPRSARAEDAELEIATAHADEVSFDVRKREIELRGNVKVDAAPFHLRSNELTVKRGPLGVEVVGNGEMSFCPCGDAPLRIGFAGARVAPPGDVFVDDPKLQLNGTTVLWLPWFWLRSPARPGILPPEIEWRGREGLLLGGGVHLPWNSEAHPREPWPKAEHPPDRILEVYGAGYVQGGARVRGRMLTPSSDLTLTWDDYRGDHGVIIDARGAVNTDKNTGVAWDVDALRGTRAVQAATDVREAALRYDRARMETRLSAGPMLFGLGAVGESARGAFDMGAYGPRAFVRASGQSLNALSYAATIDGGALSGRDVRAQDGRLSDLGFARGTGDARAATTLGPVAAALSMRAEHTVLSDSRDDHDDVARGTIGLPFGRAFERDDGDHILHRIEPRISAAATTVDLGDTLTFAPLHGEALTADAGLRTALGRYAHRDGVELEGAVGHVATRGAPAAEVARYRLAASGRMVGAVVDGAHLLADERSSAVHAEVRVGPLTGVNGAVHVSGLRGVDPVAARLIFDRSEEAFTGFFAREGVTTGGRATIPIVRALVLSVYGDYDPTANELVDLGGSVTLRDACGCASLRLGASHRVGRDGVDAALSLVLTPK